MAEISASEAPVWGMCWTKSFSFIRDILFLFSQKHRTPPAGGGCGKYAVLRYVLVLFGIISLKLLELAAQLFQYAE